MVGIYKITNTLDNKCYIGQSTDIEHRFREHQIGRDVRTNIHLKRAIKKYGIENFTFEVLEECSKELLNDREIHWIQYYKSLDKDMLYNIAEGGHGGDTISNLPKDKYDAYILKKCKPRSEEFRKGQSIRGMGKNNSCYGKKWINNGIIEKRVSPDELDKYLNNGWKLGFIKIRGKKCATTIESVDGKKNTIE